MSESSLPDLELPDLEDGGAGGAYAAAAARIMAYWADECARDLDRLMAHFTSDAEVVTPDGAFRGREAVASLYQKSFDSFPGLTVDVSVLDKDYQTSRECTAGFNESMKIAFDKLLPKWNYRAVPQPA